MIFLSIYLIDYENTSISGIKGIDKLLSKDKVIIFYSQKAGAISFNLHVQICKSKVELEYIKIDKTGKNYLDFQLASYIGYLIGTTNETRYYIITKDAGYESIIELWKKRKSHLNIKRYASIEESINPPKNAAPIHMNNPEISLTLSSKKPHQNKPATQAIIQLQKEIATTLDCSNVAIKLPESYRKKIRLKIKAENLKGGSYNTIYNLFIKCTSKQELSAGLIEAFQQDKGMALYKLLSPEFESFLSHKSPTC